MRRRWMRLVALAAVAAAIVLVVWLQPGGPVGEPRLTGLQPDAIDDVRVQRPNREDLVLRRGRSGWEILAPSRAAASEFHVRQVLEVARARSEVRFERDALDAGTLGLDPPGVRLELDEVVLEFGGTDPVDGYRYVAVDDRVHLVRDSVTPLLEGGWWNFLDRHLVPPGWEPVSVETDRYHLVREGGSWRDRRGNLSREQISSLTADLRLASALVVREGRRQADAEPALTIRFDNDEVRRFVPTEQDGELRLHEQESGLAYVLDGAVRRYLLTGSPEASADMENGR